MRVNRVFCYSKEIAKQNGNQLPIFQLVFSTLIMVIAMFFIRNMFLFIILLFAFMGVLIYYSLILGARLKTGMTGWATTDDGRIFKAMAVNNGQGLYFGGVAAGSMFDHLTNNSNNLGRDLGGAIGATTQIYSMNKSAQYMSHPEIVAKMVEEAPNITGAEVIEILRVYNIVEKRHSIQVNCDYKFLRTDEVKYYKNMNIEKSYNQLTELINLIGTHK